MDSFRFYVFCYLLFVVYGSLVPLDYKPLAFDQALNKFENIQFLKLGIESRADWIANILLYIPLSFLLLGSFLSKSHSHAIKKIFLSFLVIVFCLITAVGVEFTQLFFPPRTVSLNDLVAEAIGTGLGIVCWHGFGPRITGLFAQAIHAKWFSVKASILFYIAVYVLISLFPFDFVASLSELKSKVSITQDNWFISVASCQESLLRCGLKFLVEIALLMPLGGLFAALPFVPNRKGLAIVVGLLLGSFIEFTQIFIYSASAQGFSVITRIFGMYFGVKAYEVFRVFDINKLRSKILPLILISLCPYFFLVAAVNGWLDGRWISVVAAQAKLRETNFLPFYYFYYTTETVALVSLLSNIGYYLPVGFLYWLDSLRNEGKENIHWFWVGISAAIMAIVVEMGKLFLVTKHVDPTDILIAFFAASGGYVFMCHAQFLVSDKGGTSLVKSTGTAQLSTETDDPAADVNAFPLKELKRYGLLAVFVLVIGYSVMLYPLRPVLLALCLGAYGFLLFRISWLWLAAPLALLPIIDFAPWTGRFFFDEYDLIILTSAMSCWMLPKIEQRPSINGKLLPAATLLFFLLLVFISLIIGLFPLPGVDANAFSNYYSNYNALRIAKGVLWAILFSPFLITALNNQAGRQYFSVGLILGLFGLSVFSVIERFVFPGLLDFSTDYRINALFSTMHTGGGHIESYLALAMPFIAILFVGHKKPLIFKLLGVFLFILSLHTLLMTFSRGGMIGLAIGFLVLLASLFFHFQNKTQFNRRKSLGLVALLLTLIAVLAIPVLTGDLMKHRVEAAKQDSEIRHKHWSAAIQMMDGDWVTQLFGMGLGSFPRTFFWSNQENAHPATYSIGAENGNQYLVLLSGDSLYMGQYVATTPHQHYKLVMDVRTPNHSGALSIPICEKSLQYSFRCVGAETRVTGQQWQRFEKDIDMGDVGASSSSTAGSWLTRPVQLALYAGGGVGDVVEVDNLGLFDATGRNLIVNGDFSGGTDGWYFSTEKHNPWHIFNIWVQVLFDMGWLGLVAFAVLIACVYYNLFRSLKHDVYAPILLSSFTGFLVIGYVDSPFDAPRLTFLFSILVVFALFGCKRPVKSFATIQDSKNERFYPRPALD